MCWIGGLKIQRKTLVWLFLVLEKIDLLKKCKRKGRRNKDHPAVGPSKYVGDEPKVSPRFNLRDRTTIKKVYK